MAYKSGYSGTTNPNPITGMRIYWVENSYSIENNTSNVTFHLQVYGNVDVGSRSYSGSMNGSSFSGSNNPSGSNQTWHTISTIIKNVAHNTDGTGSIYGSWTQAWNYTSGTYGWTSTYTVSLSSTSLTTIPRATTPSLSSSSVTMGNSVTITLNRASSNFTHDLSFTLNGTTKNIASSVGTSYSWTPSVADYAPLIPNNTSMTGTLTCTTKNGSTTIGTKTINVTLQIPSSVKPTISLVCTDTKGYLTTYGGYVQGKSTLQVAITANGTNGSTISSYSTTFDGSTKSGSTAATVTFATLIPNDSRTISSTVTDSRGRTATTTTTINVLEYNSPQISLAIDRCDNQGNPDPSGTNIDIQATLTITSLNGSNKTNTNIEIKYIKTTDDQDVAANWHSITPTITKSNTIITASKTIPSTDLDSNSAYLFKINAYDSLTVLPTIKRIVDSTYSLMDFKANKKGVAFGTTADMDDTLKCAFQLVFRTSNGNWAIVPDNENGNLSLEWLG